MNLLLNSLSALALIFCMSAFAQKSQTEIFPEQKQVEEKFNMTFSNYKATHFKESPIPGVYEVHSGPKLAYFYPEKGLLLFGHIYNKEGKNLTEESLSSSINPLLESLDLSLAVTITEGDIELIEVSNPDCGFCRRFDQWFAGIQSKYSVNRKIVYMKNSNFPYAKQKMLHLLCSQDKAKAHHELMSNLSVDYKSCDEGKKILSEHQHIVNTLGVQGTPTFILPNGKMITGFKQDQIENYLKNPKS